MSIGAYKHDGPNNYRFADWVDQCQTLEITNSWIDGKNFDGRWGFVNIPAKWKNNY